MGREMKRRRSLIQKKMLVGTSSIMQVEIICPAPARTDNVKKSTSKGEHFATKVTVGRDMFLLFSLK